MAKTLILSIVLLAVAVAGMAITIIVKKDGKFPDGEISHNKELRKRGIICAKEEEIRLWGRKGKKGRVKCPEGGCEGCSFFESHSDRREAAK